MKWNPVETIPMDGTEILLKTDVGIVSAWFCHEAPTDDDSDDGCYDWICYDDMFQIDGHNNNIEAWMPIPDTSIFSQKFKTGDRVKSNTTGSTLTGVVVKSYWHLDSVNIKKQHMRYVVQWNSGATEDLWEGEILPCA